MVLRYSLINGNVTTKSSKIRLLAFIKRGLDTPSYYYTKAALFRANL